MNISIFTILFFTYIIFWIKHVFSKPDLTQLGFDATILYFHQLWFLQGMTTFLLIADVFYDLLKDK